MFQNSVFDVIRGTVENPANSLIQQCKPKNPIPIRQTCIRTLIVNISLHTIRHNGLLFKKTNIDLPTIVM